MNQAILGVGILVLCLITQLCTGERNQSNVTSMLSIAANMLQADTLTKKISKAELKKYEGEYLLQGETKTLPVKIFLENGELKAHPAGQTAGTMKYVGNHTFIHTTNADISVKFTVEKGKAVMMTLYQRGKQVDGKRVATK
ncbi:MAG TPA: hypothetical protein VGD40_09465 [Chryseosolibacter sp.]